MSTDKKLFFVLVLKLSSSPLWVNILWWPPLLLVFWGCFYIRKHLLSEIYLYIQKMPKLFELRRSCCKNTQCQRQIMGFPETQHFCEISLWVNIHKKNFFTVHCKACAEIIRGSAFSNTAFLICNGNYFWFHLVCSFLFCKKVHIDGHFKQLYKFIYTKQ